MKQEIFGRDKYLKVLEMRILGILDGYRRNIALIGEELVGKTSIIFKFLSTFTHNRILIIYLETRSESMHAFARRFIGVLLYNFLVNSGIPLKEDLDFLIRKADRFIPRTIEKIKAILNAVERNKRNNIFTELLGLLDSFYEETGKATVVILDEFHNLEAFSVKTLFREWARLLMTQKNTMYIIISSKKFRTKSILAKDLSLLFGNFEQIVVEPFDIHTAGLYLQQELNYPDLNIGIKNFLVHFTGGHPFYLEIICDFLRQQSQFNLVEVLEKLLFESSGVLNQKFSSYIKQFINSNKNNVWLSILYLVSCGKNKIKDIQAAMRLTRDDLGNRINFLLESDILSRNGDFLKITDRVFAFWLRFVYQEKIDSLTFNAHNQQLLFRKKVEEAISEFITSCQRPFQDRMTDLLYSFDDDRMQLETKKIRLSHFREVKPLEFESLNLKYGILGRSQDCLWIMALKSGSLTEEDVADFSRECKKYRYKTKRKVIVTLREIDQNTRLRALEENVWAWDLNNLNQIMDLFSKPWVVA
jgi:hypothetical protein